MKKSSTLCYSFSKMFRKSLLAVGFFLVVILLSGCALKKKPAALQIKATPTANVLIDGKLLGKTPYQSGDLKAGEISLKLIPESTATPLVVWEGKIKLNSGVLTLVNRELAATEAQSNGEILSLEKSKNKTKASLSIVSNPDTALVNLDGEAKGFTPINLEEAGAGDHQIVLTKEGFQERTIMAKAVAGFKLVVNAKLAQDNPLASSSGTPSSAGETKSSQKVKIKDTPTGWLRVRKEPSTAAVEVTKVNPGEEYVFLEEKSGWYKIELENGESGWIAGQYASKP